MKLTIAINIIITKNHFNEIHQIAYQLKLATLKITFSGIDKQDGTLACNIVGNFLLHIFYLC